MRALAPNDWPTIGSIVKRLKPSGKVPFTTVQLPEPIIAKIRQETLAEMIGTTRSRVSFFMNKFRKLGFIHYNGSIEVHSSLLNLILHEEPHIET